MHTHTHTCISAHMYTCTLHAHTHAHTHTRTHTYTHRLCTKLSLVDHWMNTVSRGEEWSEGSRLKWWVFRAALNTEGMDHEGNEKQFC